MKRNNVYLLLLSYVFFSVFICGCEWGNKNNNIKIDTLSIVHIQEDAKRLAQEYAKNACNPQYEYQKVTDIVNNEKLKNVLNNAAKVKGYNPENAAVEKIFLDKFSEDIPKQDYVKRKLLTKYIKNDPLYKKIRSDVEAFKKEKRYKEIINGVKKQRNILQSNDYRLQDLKNNLEPTLKLLREETMQQGQKLQIDSDIDNILLDISSGIEKDDMKYYYKCKEEDNKNNLKQKQYYVNDVTLGIKGEEEIFDYNVFKNLVEKDTEDEDIVGIDKNVKKLEIIDSILLDCFLVLFDIVNSCNLDQNDKRIQNNISDLIKNASNVITKRDMLKFLINICFTFLSDNNQNGKIYIADKWYSLVVEKMFFNLLGKAYHDKEIDGNDFTDYIVRIIKCLDTMDDDLRKIINTNSVCKISNTKKNDIDSNKDDVDVIISIISEFIQGNERINNIITLLPFRKQIFKFIKTDLRGIIEDFVSIIGDLVSKNLIHNIIKNVDLSLFLQLIFEHIGENIDLKDLIKQFFFPQSGDTGQNKQNNIFNYIKQILDYIKKVFLYNNASVCRLIAILVCCSMENKSLEFMYDQFISLVGREIIDDKLISNALKNLTFYIYCILECINKVLQKKWDSNKVIVFVKLFFYIISNYKNNILEFPKIIIENKDTQELLSEVQKNYGTDVCQFVKIFYDNFFIIVAKLLFGKNYENINIRDTVENEQDDTSIANDIVELQCFHDKFKDRNRQEIKKKYAKNMVTTKYKHYLSDNISQQHKCNKINITQIGEKLYSIRINDRIVIKSQNNNDDGPFKEIKFPVEDDAIVDIIDDGEGYKVYYDGEPMPDKHILALVTGKDINNNDYKKIIYCENADSRRKDAINKRTIDEKSFEDNDKLINDPNGSNILLSDENDGEDLWQGLFQDVSYNNIRILSCGSEIENMNSMFSGCRHVKKLDLSKLHTSNVTDMSNMFYNCSSLKELDFSNLNLEKVIKKDNIFYGCSNSEMCVYCNGKAWKSLITKQIVGKKSDNINKDAIEVAGKKNVHNVVEIDNIINVIIEEENNNEINFKCDNPNECDYKKLNIKMGKLGGNDLNIINEDVEDEKKDVEKANWKYGIITGNFNDRTYYLKLDNNNTNKAIYTFINALQIKEDKRNLLLVNEINQMQRDVKKQNKKYLLALVTVNNIQYLIYCTDANSKKEGEITYGLFQESAATKIVILSCGSEIENMDGMFAYCELLSSLDLSSLDTENVTNMSNMFNNCSSLTELDLSNFNTTNVTDMRNMFNGSGLTELDLFSFNTNKVKDMSGMFYWCSSLKNLNISSFNTTNVTNMSNMFSFCSSLKKLNISSFNTSNVTDMSDMFFNCSSLAELDLSNFNTTNVTNMIWMFSGIITKAVSNDFIFILRGRLATTFCDQNQLVELQDGIDDAYIYIIQHTNGKLIKKCQDALISNIQLLEGVEAFIKDIDMRNDKVIYRVDLTQGKLEYSPVCFEEKKYNYLKSQLSEKILTTLLLKNIYCSMSSKKCYEDIRQHLKEDVGICLNMIKLVDDYDIDNFSYEEYITMLFYIMRKKIGRYYNYNDVSMYNFEKDIGVYCFPDKLRFDSGKSNLVNEEAIISHDESNNGKDYKLQQPNNIPNIVNVTLENGVYNLRSPRLKSEGGKNADPKICHNSFVKLVHIKDLNRNSYNNLKSKVQKKTDALKIKIDSSRQEHNDTYLLAIIKFVCHENQEYYYLFYCEDANSIAGGYYYDGLFENIGDLYEVIILDSGSAISSIAKMFQACRSLTELDFSNFKASNIENMFFMLACCEKLIKVDLSNFATCTYIKTQVYYIGFNITDIRGGDEGCKTANSKLYLTCPIDCIAAFLYHEYNYSQQSNKYNYDVITAKMKDKKNKIYEFTLMVCNISTFSKGREIPISFFNNVDSRHLSIIDYKIVKCIDKYNNTCKIDEAHITIPLKDTKKKENDDTTRILNIQMENSEDILNTSISITMNRLCEHVFSAECKEDNVYNFVESLRGYEVYSLNSSGIYWYREKYILALFTTEELRDIKEDQNINTNSDYQKLNSNDDSKKTKKYYVVYIDDYKECAKENRFCDLLKDKHIIQIEILSCGSKIDDMSRMFHNCENLLSLDLSSLDTENVTNMSNMFAYCSSLTKIIFPDNVNTSKVTNMSCMFEGCSSLTELNLSKFNTNNVTNMFRMFYNCSSLTNLDLSNFNTTNVTNMQDMFANCSSLTNLDLSSFDTENVTNMQSMFYNCRSLTNLDLSNFNTGNVTYMQNMFKRCNSLLNLNLSHFDTSNVEYMFGMFSGCSSLKELNLSSFNTDNVKDMSDMFSVCCKVLNLDLSNFNTTNVKDMNFMFMYCSNLETLYLGEKFSLVAAAKRDNIDFMFKNCFNFYTDTSLLKCFGHVINIIKKYNNTGLPLCKGILNKKIYNNIQYTCNFSMCVFLDHK